MVSDLSGLLLGTWDSGPILPIYISNIPSSISGGKPPTNTFLEYFSSFSCNKVWGDDCAPGGSDAMNTCPSTMCELGFSIMAAAACSSKPGKNGRLSANREKSNLRADKRYLIWVLRSRKFFLYLRYTSLCIVIIGNFYSTIDHFWVGRSWLMERGKGEK